MKTIKNVRLTRIVVLAMVVCMAFSLLMPITAQAANTAVTDAKNGVLQVRMTYVDELGLKTDVGSGTGFLVNTNTLVTANHVVTMPLYGDEDEWGATEWAEYFGISVSEFTNRLRIRVTLTRDVTVDATVLKQSETMDFAILRLNEEMKGKTPLAMKPSKDVAQTETVWAIGFPDITRHTQSFNTYTSDDVVVKDGRVSKNGPYGDANVDHLQTSVDMDYGMSGGPMLDDNGFVVGVCVHFVRNGATTEYYAVGIDQVVEVLQGLGIPCEYIEGSTPVVTEPPVTTAPPVTTEAPTPDTTAAPVPAESQTLPPVPTTVPNPNPNPGMDMTMILIIAGVAVAVIVLVIILVVAGGKKKKAAAPAAPNFVPAAPPAGPRNSFDAPPTAPIQNAGETTVLGGSAGETTVLGRTVNGGSLVMKRTGRTTAVNAENFLIGRERKCNLCISDNTNVSREHAKVTVRGGAAYLVNVSKTNETLVNGNKVQYNQEVMLKNGDRITLANEELEYRN